MFDRTLADKWWEIGVGSRTRVYSLEGTNPTLILHLQILCVVAREDTSEFSLCETTFFDTEELEITHHRRTVVTLVLTEQLGEL